MEKKGKDYKYQIWTDNKVNVGDDRYQAEDLFWPPTNCLQIIKSKSKGNCEIQLEKGIKSSHSWYPGGVMPSMIKNKNKNKPIRNRKCTNKK